MKSKPKPITSPEQQGQTIPDEQLKGQSVQQKY